MNSKPQQSPIGGGTECVSMTLGRMDAAVERTWTYSQRVMETYSVLPQRDPLEARRTEIRNRVPGPGTHEVQRSNTIAIDKSLPRSHKKT
jgi:hypothetical protein